MRVKFKFMEVIVELTSDDVEFISFIRSNLSHHLQNDVEREQGCAHIRVSYTKQQNKSNIATTSDVSQSIDGIRYRYHLNDDLQLSVLAYPEGKIKFTNILRKIRRKVYPWRTDYFLLCRRLIIFPVLHYLTSHYGWTPIHASAFEKNAQIYILSGLANVGKTTTALAAVLEDNARLIADNFVLIRGNEVTGIVEGLRIDYLSPLNSIIDANDVYFKRNNRNFVKLADEKICVHGFFEKIYLTFLTDVAKIKIINKEEGWSRLINYTLYVDEFQFTDIVNTIYIPSKEKKSIAAIPIFYKLDLSRSLTPLENVRFLYAT